MITFDEVQALGLHDQLRFSGDDALKVSELRSSVVVSVPLGVSVKLKEPTTALVPAAKVMAVDPGITEIAARRLRESSALIRTLIIRAGDGAINRGGGREMRRQTRVHGLAGTGVPGHGDCSDVSVRGRRVGRRVVVVRIAAKAIVSAIIVLMCDRSLRDGCEGRQEIDRRR